MFLRRLLKNEYKREIACDLLSGVLTVEQVAQVTDLTPAEKYYQSSTVDK